MTKLWFSVQEQLSHGDQAEKMGGNTPTAQPSHPSHASGLTTYYTHRKLTGIGAYLSWVHVGQPLISPYRGKTQGIKG